VGRDEFWSSGELNLPGHDGRDIGCNVANASVILRTLLLDNPGQSNPAASMMRDLRIKICGGGTTQFEL